MERVLIVVSQLMNNFAIIHQGAVVGDKQVFFHNDPRMSASGDVANFNFDIMITDGTLKIDGIPAENITPPHRLHLNKRYNKFEQALRINNVAAAQKDDPDFSTFVPVKSWWNIQSRGASNLINPTGKVVIKPADGARGIGQLLIDPAKIPMVVAIDALDRYRLRKYTEEQFLRELMKFDPDFTYSTASEYEINEGLESLKVQGYVIQSFIDNVSAEYRLLTDKDSRVAYCQRRTIRKDTEGFPQATGSDTNSISGEDIVDIASVMEPGQHRALCTLLERVVGPMSSIDLFTTSDGGWGIFEYCNQFGIKGVPMELTERMHREFLQKLIEDM